MNIKDILKENYTLPDITYDKYGMPDYSKYLDIISNVFKNGLGKVQIQRFLQDKLEITGRSLLEGYDVESADITLKFNPQIFNNIEVSDVTLGTDLPINNSIDINNVEGSIRIAAASLAHLGEGGFITTDKVLASFTLDFDESSLSTFETTEDGSLVVSPLVL